MLLVLKSHLFLEDAFSWCGRSLGHRCKEGPVAIFTLDSVRGKGPKDISWDIDDLVLFEGLSLAFFFTVYFLYPLATMLWDL